MRESILDDHVALRHHEVHRFEIAPQNRQRKSSSDPGVRVIDPKPARNEVPELRLLTGVDHGITFAESAPSKPAVWATRLGTPLLSSYVALTRAKTVCSFS
jgi:hypothetical protein